MNWWQKNSKRKNRLWQAHLILNFSVAHFSICVNLLTSIHFHGNEWPKFFSLFCSYHISSFVLIVRVWNGTPLDTYSKFFCCIFGNTHLHTSTHWGLKSTMGQCVFEHTWGLMCFSEAEIKMEGLCVCWKKRWHIERVVNFHDREVRQFQFSPKISQFLKY